MMGSKVGAVAAFEFLSTVKRKGYLFATFGMPLILLAYGGLISGIGMFINSQEENNIRVYGIIDAAGFVELEGDVERSRIPEEVLAGLRMAGREDALGPMVQLGTAIFRPYDDAERAKTELLDGVLAGYFVIPADWIRSGQIEAFYADGIDLNSSEAREALGELLLDRVLETGVEPELVDRVRDPIARTISWTVRADGEVVERSVGGVLLGLLVPVGFTILLFVAVMMNTGYLVQGLAVEKENKVVEVLLSSANPDQVLGGKLLGLGAAGLLQILVWFSMVFAAAIFFAGLLASFGAELPWAAMAAGIPFFATAYFFYGALMLATGSLGNNSKEAQQYSGIFGLFAAIPMMFLAIIIQDPHSTAAQVLSWIPFTAPVTLIMRLALDAPGVSWVEIIGGFLLMCLSIWAALRAGGRLFRVGLLLSGARPKLREILRQARLSAG